MSGDGYRHETGALVMTAGLLRNGATALDEAAACPPRAVDAGASSATVGDMLADVVRGLATAAHNLDGAASGVDATSGAYDEVDNTNEGELTYKSGYGRGPGNYVPDDPPMTERPEPPPPPQSGPYDPGNGPGSMDPEDVPREADGTPVGSLPEGPPGGTGPVSGPYDPGNGPGSHDDE